MPLFIRATFRDSQVYARCETTGELTVDDGFVGFRYQPKGKTYRTRGERLTVEEGSTPEEMPEEPTPMPPAAGGSGASPPSRATTTWRSEDDAVQIWTDGACTGNPGPAGIGVHLRYRGDVQEVSEYLGHGTNNVAELMAILRGIELVEDPSTPVDIMTDSSYCVGLLTKGWKAKANPDLVKALRLAFARLTNVRVVKVKGHAGVGWNDRADELAVDAVRSRP